MAPLQKGQLSFSVTLTSAEFASKLQQLMPALGPGPFDFLYKKGSSEPFELLEGDTPSALKVALKGSQSKLYIRPKVHYIIIDSIYMSLRAVIQRVFFYNFINLSKKTTSEHLYFFCSSLRTGHYYRRYFTHMLQQKVRRLNWQPSNE